MTPPPDHASPTPSPAVVRLQTTAFWLVPMFFALSVYRYGLRAWFQGDDFLWLGLKLRIHNWHDLMWALFSPTVHGTFRPLSERAFFLAFSSLFDLDGLPYRIWVFLTLFAVLALLTSVTWRITGLRAAGFLAPILWVANSNLANVMAWNSAYMQILCAFFLVLAFRFFLQYIETGERRYYVWQWVVFVVGFLVMETNVMYPAMAGGYALLCSRKHFRATLPLFPASALFLALHMGLIKKVHTGPYAMYLDPASVWHTFSAYWVMTFFPRNLSATTGIWGWVGALVLVACTLALLGFAGWQAYRRNFLPLCLLSWFVLLLAPLLPLRDHVSPYLLTLPTIGLAMLGAYGLAFAWRGKPAWKLAAVLLCGLYLFVSVPAARAGVRWWTDRSNAAKPMVLGVRTARQLHPGKVILLTGVSDEFFWGAVRDRAFVAAGVEDVLLAPETEASIAPHPELGGVKEFILEPGLVSAGLREDRLVVYDASGPRLRNITQIYEGIIGSRPAARAPSRLDVGPSLADAFLGKGWYRSEHSFRWMGKSARLRIGGPRSASAHLFVSGYCPPDLAAQGPVRLAVTLAGRPVPPAQIPEGGRTFELQFPVPADLAGQPELEVGLTLNRTFRPTGEDRDLGLSFGVFEVK